ncbi:ATP-binding protein [Pseudomonas fragi]|uniref:AAA family ATPase n=1 Tax=Pseudomonas fragi TaxID=296 RepID=UPI001475CA73|nr:ATP-binding protein [Pseudomonas fragi]NNB07935.1 ATP-binding protein [Pseudomonas fragi]
MPTSYIESLHAKNIRQFGTINVKFNNKFNFIAGPNGCGKTSILTCISHCFYYGSSQYSRIKESTEFWTDFTSKDVKYRLGIGKGSFHGDEYRKATIKAWTQIPDEENRVTLLPHDTQNNSRIYCPLFLGTNRSIAYKQISGMQREAEYNQKRDNYTQIGVQSLHGEHRHDIKQWIVNRDFIIGKDWALEERKNWNHLISSLPTIAPFDSNFSYIRTGRNLEPTFSIYGQECYLEELSSGFQAILSIIANIFEWIEGSRPEGERDVSTAQGTVLIDELDLHLHPEWQFTLREGLIQIFPNLQFIVTTHSPHLLSSAGPGEVIAMHKSAGCEIYDLQPTPHTYSGWNTDQILHEIMGVRSLDNKLYEKLITEAFIMVDTGTPEELEIAIRQLDNVAHPSDTIVSVLQAKLAAKTATYND